MKKRRILAIVSGILSGVCLLLMGLEILGSMDPNRIRIYTYLTGLGLAGLFLALLFRLREREEKKHGEAQERKDAEKGE